MRVSKTFLKQSLYNRQVGAGNVTRLLFVQRIHLSLTRYLSYNLKNTNRIRKTSSQFISIDDLCNRVLYR